MAQTQVQKANAVRLGSGVLKIDGTNIGLLNNAALTVEYNVIQIRANNGYLPSKKKPSRVALTAEIYEIDVANLLLVDGAGDVANIADTPVNVAGEALGTGWTVGTPIKLANKNGNGTIVTSIVIDAAGSPLTAGTDYKAFLDSDGFTYILPLTVQAGVLDADYTYTPNESQKYTIKDVARLLTTHVVTFENTDENGKIFKITIPKGNSANNIVLGFVSDDAVDEAMTLPVEFVANPDEDNVMVFIEDEQSV